MPAPARARKAPTKPVSLEERIRRRAYELYVERGNQQGSDLNDWLQAEEEIRRTQEQAMADHLGKRLWLIPNEVGGLKLTFPEDY